VLSDCFRLLGGSHRQNGWRKTNDVGSSFACFYYDGGKAGCSAVVVLKIYFDRRIPDVR